MSTWDSFSKTAIAGEGNDDFPDRDKVPDGTYHAVCIRVSEPYDKPNKQSGAMQTKFVAEFALTGKKLRGRAATLPSFITFPPKYLDEGVLSDKSNMYKVMKAMGYDMDDKFTVNPPEWAEEGYSCDVIVENSKEGDTETAWITKYLACECEEVEAEPEPVAVAAAPRGGPPKKAPVGAGLAGRLQP